MNDSVIKVENLSKQYRIGAREGYRTFRETLVDAAKSPFARLSGALSKGLGAKSKELRAKERKQQLYALCSRLSAVCGRRSFIS